LQPVKKLRWVGEFEGTVLRVTKVRIRIKICGVCRSADVDACVEAGVDAIGFNCWPRSPRYIRAHDAAWLVSNVPASILPVGVFVKASPEEVAETARIARFRAIQLHGDEDPTSYAHLPVEIIQVIRMKEREGLPNRPAPACVHHVLLDSHVAQFGGAGQTFDWALALLAKDRLGRDVMIGGGLTPDNVREAIRGARPWGVDVASGVESSPGVKDPGKIRDFVAAVRSAEAELG